MNTVLYKVHKMNKNMTSGMARSCGGPFDINSHGRGYIRESINASIYRNFLDMHIPLL